MDKIIRNKIMGSLAGRAISPEMFEALIQPSLSLQAAMENPSGWGRPDSGSLTRADLGFRSPRQKQKPLAPCGVFPHDGASGLSLGGRSSQVTTVRQSVLPPVRKPGSRRIFEVKQRGCFHQIGRGERVSVGRRSSPSGRMHSSIHPWTSLTLHEVGCGLQHSFVAIVASIHHKANRPAKNTSVLVPTRSNNINASGLVKRDSRTRGGFRGADRRRSRPPYGLGISTIFVRTCIRHSFPPADTDIL